MPDVDILAGFHPLRPGRIHIQCPACRRRRSNSHRIEWDPKRAVMAFIKCPRCSSGDKDCTTDYFDAEGKPVDWFEDEEFGRKE